MTTTFMDMLRALQAVGQCHGQACFSDRLRFERARAAIVSR
jgi:hypothetical protein